MLLQQALAFNDSATKLKIIRIRADTSGLRTTCFFVRYREKIAAYQAINRRQVIQAAPLP